MRRLLSRGKLWSIPDYDEAMRPVVYRFRVQRTPAGIDLLEADPFVPPTRYEAVLEKIRERAAMKEAP